MSTEEKVPTTAAAITAAKDEEVAAAPKATEAVPANSPAPTDKPEDTEPTEGQEKEQASAKPTGGPFGKLFVGQVPAVCTEEMLTPLFQPYGTLLEIKIMRDSQGRSKGCAWVRYETQAQAQAAIEALHEKHTIPPQTNMLQVRYAQSRNGVDKSGECASGDAAGHRSSSNSDARVGRGVGDLGGSRVPRGGVQQMSGGGAGGFGGSSQFAAGGFSPMAVGSGGGNGGGGFGGAQAAAFSPYGNMGMATSFMPSPMFYNNSSSSNNGNNLMMQWQNPMMAAGGFGGWGAPDAYGWTQGAMMGAGVGGMLPGLMGGMASPFGGPTPGPRLRRSPPGSSCFFGNLPLGASSAELRAFVETNAPSLNITNVSLHRDKRFGFVTFETPEEATQAAQILNSLNMQDTTVRVEVTQHEPKNSFGPAKLGVN